MKCVCGYEYERDRIYNYDAQKHYDINIGDQEFINIQGSFHIRTDYDDKVVSLKACPKCKTIQMYEGW